jgi:predicted nucleic acid-binding protein
VYLVDTNVISEPTHRAPSRKVLSWLARSAVVGVSVVTIMELEAGIGAAPASKRLRLQEWLETLLGSGAVEVHPVDTAVARVAGRLRAARRSRPVATEDLLIAATALSRGAVLATRNTRHFEGLGVPIVNPWD